MKIQYIFLSNFLRDHAELQEMLLNVKLEEQNTCSVHLVHNWRDNRFQKWTLDYSSVKYVSTHHHGTRPFDVNNTCGVMLTECLLNL